MKVPKTESACWFYTHGLKKRGPLSWDHLVEAAERGELTPDDLVVAEGSKFGVPARSLAGLFPQPTARQDAAHQLAKPQVNYDLTLVFAEVTELSARLGALAAGGKTQTPARDVPVSKENPAEVSAAWELAEPPSKGGAVLADPLTFFTEPDQQRAEPSPAPPLADAPVTFVLEAPLGIAEAPPEVAVATKPRESPAQAWLGTKGAILCASALLLACAVGVGTRVFTDRRDRNGAPGIDRNMDEPQEPASGDLARHNRGSAERKSREWPGEFVARLNRHRQIAGLAEIALDTEFSRGCAAHAKYLVRNVAAEAATPLTVYREEPNTPGYTIPGQETAGVALVSYIDPLQALDRWMGRLFSRVQLLDPAMNRLGIGCAENRDGNWICVVDAVHGRTAGSPDRAVAVVLWPAPDQQDVPCQGFDRIDEAPDHEVGFPVSVTFPGQTQLRKVRAALTDAAGHPVDVRISSPEQPLNAKLQGASIGLHPLHELRSGRTYTVSLSASVDGTPWKHRWTFTTTK